MLVFLVTADTSGEWPSCIILVLTPKLFDEKHFVNEAVQFPVAFLENAKLVLIEKIFVTVRF